MTSQTSKSNDEDEYQAIPLVDSTNIKSSFSIPKTYNQKKQCGGICCLLCLVTFLLCFFLIPRQPIVVLQELDCYNNDHCSGDFKFKNNNFYKTSWQNPKISLYWIPYDGQSVGQVCYNDGNYCDKKIHNKCGIKIAQFQSSYNFKLESRSSLVKDLNLKNSTSQELACATWMLLNPYENLPQRLVSSGYVHVKSDINDFGDVDVNEEYYYIN